MNRKIYNRKVYASRLRDEPKFDRTAWQALSWVGRIILLIVILPAVFGLSCLLAWFIFTLIFWMTL